MRGVILLFCCVILSACSEERKDSAEWRARAVLGPGPDGVLLRCDSVSEPRGASFSVIADRDVVLEWAYGKMEGKSFEGGVEEFKVEGWRLVSAVKYLKLDFGEVRYVDEKETATYQVEAVLHYLSEKEIRCEVDVMWLY